MDSLKWANAVLTTTPARWNDLTAMIPVEMLTQAPVPGEWSAVECLQHLIETEQYVFPIRVRAFLAGQAFPAFNPGDGQSGAGQTDPVELAVEFARLRSESLMILSDVASTDLDRRALHAELGPVCLEEMLNEWAAHDLNHTVQAERALMQPFIRGCGPWQFYFKDHVMK
jgi:hypothetical protein